MSEQKKGKSPFQWHSAFYAGLQIELEKESSQLVFENEHQLGTKPMGIDVLIIKKSSGIPIQKNIGRIFRTYNIIEYKSPDDYLSIDDSYKVYGYCCFYKSDVPTVDLIKAEELTISLVSYKYPRKLIWHLRSVRHYTVECAESGIYQVTGDFIPIQIIVSSQLTQKENLWLRSLTNEIQDTSMVEALLESYKENRKNPLYKSVMNIVVQANTEKFEEVKDMCEALEELMKDRIEERAEERAQQIAEERAQQIAEERAKQIAEEQVKCVNVLIAELLKQNRLDDIAKAVKNQAYQMKLIEEFQL